MEQEPTIIQRAALGARVYVLFRADCGYGFTLSGECPSVITSIVPDTPAEKTGLRPGLLILEVDGIDVSRSGHEEIVSRVAESRVSVSLLCCETELDLEELLSYQRSPSARKMNENAVFARKMSLPSSDESVDASSQVARTGGEFVPGEKEDIGVKSRYYKQRKSLMLALEEGNRKTTQAKPTVNSVEDTVVSEKSQVAHPKEDANLDLGYSVVRFPVLYFGSVQVSTIRSSPQVSVETIRQCVARVQMEGRFAPVTLEATSSGISLINPQGHLLINIAAQQLAYSGVCIDNTRFFAVVTRKPKRYEKSSHNCPLCHVFMVEGQRKSLSQDDLSRSAQESAHILQSVAATLRTRRQKGYRLRQHDYSTSLNGTSGGQIKEKQPQVYMTGRTVSVSSIDAFERGSTPDLNFLSNGKCRPLNHTVFPSLPSNVNFIGKYPSHYRNGNEVDDDDDDDAPPSEYPEEWEVLSQHNVMDLPPPPREVYESQEALVSCGSSSQSGDNHPFISAVTHQSSAVLATRKQSKDMTEEIKSDYDEKITTASGQAAPTEVEKATAEVPRVVAVNVNRLNQPSGLFDNFGFERQFTGTQQEGNMRLGSRSLRFHPDARLQQRGVKGRALLELGKQEPKNVQDCGDFFDMPRKNSVLSVSMDSLALMSTVGSEYSIREDVGRIASWALSLSRLLKDPEGVACLKEFMSSEHSEENLLFWVECQNFSEVKDLAILRIEARSIYNKFLSPEAPTPVNIDYQTVQQVANGLDKPTSNMFAKAQYEVFRLMKMDCHPRFVRSTLYQQCVVAEIEGLPLPIDPPLPHLKAPGGKKTTVPKKARSHTISGSRNYHTLDPVQAQSNSSISSGYSSPGEERKKREKEKKKRLISWGSRRRKTKSQSHEDINKLVAELGSNATESHEERPHLDDVSGAVNEQMFRAIMPDSSSTIIVAKHGQTVKNALERLFERRNMDFASLDVVIQSNGEVVPYEAPASCLNRKEVRLQSAGLTFKATFPDERSVTVKVDKKKTIREVLTGVMFERGLDLNNYVAHLDNCKVPLQLDITSSLLVNQNICIKPAKQLTNGSDEDERTASTLSLPPEKTSPSRFKLRIPGMRRSADVDYEMKKLELLRTGSNDTTYCDELISLPSNSPKKEQLRKEIEKNRKSTKKKGKEEAPKHSEPTEKSIKPAPSTDDLIQMLNRVQCDRLDDQRTGLPEPTSRGTTLPRIVVPEPALPDLVPDHNDLQETKKEKRDKTPPFQQADHKDSQRKQSWPHPSVVLRNKRRLISAPFVSPTTVPSDSKKISDSNPMVAVPDLCPSKDPGFTHPPDITNIKSNPNQVANCSPNHQLSPDQYPTRQQRSDFQPLVNAPVSCIPFQSKSESRKGDRPRRLMTTKGSEQQRTRNQPVPFSEWMPRDRIMGESSFDANGMSKENVTFV